MAARTLYQAASNTATNGVQIGDDTERDVTVWKVIVGAPVSAGNIWLYNITNPIGSSTVNIAVKVTLPTFSTTNVNPGVYVLDFGPAGLRLPEGGNLQIDQTMNVTVLWSESGTP